jgi:hypothetical protein
VLVRAAASELGAQIDHLEVGQYAWQETWRVPYGVGVNCVFIDQSVTFPESGTYQLAIMDLNLSALKGEDSQATLRITTLTLAPEGSHRPHASGF